MGELIEFPGERESEGSRSAYLARTHESALVWRVECVSCWAVEGPLLLCRCVDEGQARRWAAEHAQRYGHETRVT